MAMRRAWYSLLLLLAMYVVSLGAELVCNTRPLFLRFEGRNHFPAFCFYPEDAFLHNGVMTAPDYLELERMGLFEREGSLALWPLVKSGPYAMIPVETLERHLRIFARLTPVPQVAGVTFDADLAIVDAQNLEAFQRTDDDGAHGPVPTSLADCWELPDDFMARLQSRWNGEAAEQLVMICKGRAGFDDAEFCFANSGARNRPRKTMRVKLSQPEAELPHPQVWKFVHSGQLPSSRRSEYEELPVEIRLLVNSQLEAVERGEAPPSEEMSWNGTVYRVSCERETPQYPFRPIPGHWLGIDDAGRDVFARILYGVRIALNFGLILVLCSMGIGTVIGMLQGYLGGWVDLAGQRLIEIWSALPFLYVMILLGAIYGTSFALLLVCYAIFNWIGISYYMRAEMLRLRHTAFVESAKCLGLPGWKIAMRHILPNSLVPLITFFPFSLVGAIGSLAALDFLGFGLPTPTPSIGQLLQQAQVQRAAWWLILYPSLTLFIIMLLGVFIGEGVRNAFDPRRQNRLE